jgi:hypothetical protein
MHPNPKEGFAEWFAKVARSGGIHFTVRPHIKELPCGCVSSDEPFILKLTPSGYIHPTCMQLMPQVDEVEKPATVAAVHPPVKERTYFVR